MTDYSLPTSVEIDGKKYQINKKGDYRVILDIISLLNNNELTQHEKNYYALCVFFGYDKKKKVFKIPLNVEKAMHEMSKFLNCGDDTINENQQPRLMDWEQDFKLIVAPINKGLGFEIRTAKYLHWWTFLGAYMEIGGDSVFSQVKDIRLKKSRGEKLDKHEKAFYNNNKNIILLKNNLTKEDEDWLNSND